MGVDLTIYPVWNNETHTPEKIEFERDYLDFEFIHDLPKTDFNNGKGLRCYHSDEYSKAETDAYEQPLRFITIEAIRSLKGKMQDKNGAIINYLSELEGHIFVLYWH